jgi:hypothetical protein
VPITPASARSLYPPLERCGGSSGSYTSGYTSDYTSGYTSDYTSGYTSGYTSDYTSGYTSDYDSSAKVRRLPHDDYAPVPAPVSSGPQFSSDCDVEREAFTSSCANDIRMGFMKPISRECSELRCAETGCEGDLLGNGMCNSECNNAACNFDMGDCRCANTGCPAYLLGNSQCDEMCNNAECEDDYGDCLDRCIVANCSLYLLADGECQEECNNVACAFDMGDCLYLPPPDLIELDSCAVCPPGTFLGASSGARLCEACPEGTAQPAFGAESEEMCVECPYKTYPSRPARPVWYGKDYVTSSDHLQTFGSAQCLDCPGGDEIFGFCVSDADCLYPGCHGMPRMPAGVTSPLYGAYLEPGACVDFVCMMPGGLVPCPKEVDSCTDLPTPAPTRPPTPPPTPKPTKPAEIVQCTIAMKIDKAAVEAMAENPEAAKTALAEGYAEYLGLEPEKIEICYTNPDVGIYGDCAATALPPELAALKAEAEKAPTTTESPTTTGYSVPGEESGPPGRRLEASAPRQVLLQTADTAGRRVLLSASIVERRSLSESGEESVEFEVVFEVMAVEGEDSAAAISADLYAAGKDENMLAQLTESIQSNLEEHANITTSIEVLSVEPVIPDPTSIPEDPPPPLRPVPTRGLIPYQIAGSGTACLCFCFLIVCNYEVKKQREYKRDLTRRKKKGQVKNLGEQEVHKVAEAAQNLAKEIADKKFEVRNAGEVMNVPAKKEGRSGKEERDLDDTSSDDDSDIVEMMENAPEYPASPSAIKLELPEEKAGATKESEAQGAPPAEPAAPAEAAAESAEVLPTGVPAAGSPSR